MRTSIGTAYVYLTHSCSLLARCMPEHEHSMVILTWSVFVILKTRLVLRLVLSYRYVYCVFV